MSNIFSGKGRILTAPTVRFLANERAVCNFRINAGTTYRGSDGERKYKNFYIDCAAWGRIGETIAQHFHDGEDILVFGAMHTEGWTDKDGGKRSKAVCEVNGFDFCSGPRPGNSEYQKPANQVYRQPESDGEYRRQPARTAPPPADIGDDELPF